MKKKYTPELKERFWAKVHIPAVEQEVQCWLWTGGTNSKGYGIFTISYPVTELAHRVAYELKKSSLRAGYVVRQSCKERRCVNPNHLKQVKKSQVRPGQKYDSAAILKDYHAGLSWNQIQEKYKISNGGLARIIKRSKQEIT